MIVGLTEMEISILVSTLGGFLKSGIPIYKSEVPDTVGRKTRRRRTLATAKRYAFHANAIKQISSTRQRHIQNRFEHLRWGDLRKYLAAFRR